MTQQRHVDWGEAVIPGLTLLFVLAFFFQTWDGPRSALLWPLGVAGVLGVLWLLVVVQFLWRRRVKRKPQSAGFQSLRGRLGRSALIVLAPLGYLIVMPYAGFTLGNFIFLEVMFHGLGSRRWALNLLVGLGVAVFLHVALVALMQLSLPQLTIGGLSI